MASDAYQDQTERFNWRRTLGLAAAFALHGFAFMMLLAPMSPPQAKEKLKDNIVTVEFIEPPPPPPPPPPATQTCADGSVILATEACPAPPPPPPPPPPAPERG